MMDQTNSPPPTSSSNSVETIHDVDRLFLKLVVADSDEKLQRFTDNYLCRILNLVSKDSTLIPKITEVLTHYNKMVRNNHNIKFPVDELINVFEGDSTTASNLSLIYLKYSKDRTSAEDQVRLIPRFLAALQKKPNDVTFGFEIIGLCFPGLQFLSNLKRNDWPIKVDIPEQAVSTISRVFQSILSFRDSNINQIKSCIDLIDNNKPINCPGLCPDEYKLVFSRIIGETLNITEKQLVVVKLLGQELLSPIESFPLLVIAFSTNINAVEDVAEGLIKRCDIQALVDDDHVVKKLMYAYLGSAAETTKSTSINSIVQNGSISAKQKILTYLTRSSRAPTMYMNNIKICVDGITKDIGNIQLGALSFLLKVIENMPNSALNALGKSIFSRIRNLLKNTPSNSKSVCVAYQCLGLLGKMKPDLVFSEITIVDELLQTIPQEREDVGYAVVDCLVSWLPSFCENSPDSNVLSELKTIICHHVTHENPKCRMVCLKYMEALLNESEMQLIWILLKASGDQRDEMRSEAVRLLEISLTKALPSVTHLINSMWENLKTDVELKNGDEGIKEKKFYSEIIHQMVSQYIWAVCETTVTNEPAKLRIIEGDDHWIYVAPLIVKMLYETIPFETIDNALKMVLFSVRESSDAHQYRIAACFLTAHEKHPQSGGQERTVYKRFPTCLNECFVKLRHSTRLELAQSICCLMTILIREPHVKDRMKMFEMAMMDLDSKNVAGLCWTCAALATPLDYCGLEETKNANKMAQEIVEQLIDISNQAYENASSLVESSLGALGFVLQNHLTEFKEDKKEKMLEVLEKIAASRKDSVPQRARESAVRSIGWIVVDSSMSDNERCTQSLFRIGEGPPQPELQLTVGEALIDAILGRYSYSRRNHLTTRESEMKLDSVIHDGKELELIQSRITMLVQTLAEEKTKAQNQHLRRAAIIWLLVIVQRLSKLKAACFEDSTCLGMIQACFADGLAEDDEFTQDIASKGMGLVYAIADGELRKQLVSNLMGALSEGRRTAQKVDENTVLFQKGQLGKSPNGENLTTYKELCSLATDLNQPDLVYKFMQLAKHNAKWNAKKGAGLGFGAVLEQAKDEIEPYIGQLVPKLFRYRYDPDLKVQASMRSIWDVLTHNRKNVGKKSANLIDEHADAIAAELLPALTHKEWRVRESACMALSDLLRGHDTENMRQNLPLYFDTVLRVRDDIKESVRIAADKAADAIKRLIINQASSSNTEKAHAFLERILPMVVDQGILTATVKENKIFCLKLVLDLTKSAGQQLKPYLDKLIPTLLDAISDNESAVLNYVAVRSDAAQLEALDDARAHMARMSPMMTAIHDLLKYIDSNVLVALTPKLSDQLRGSVGVSTRSAAAQLVTQLAIRAPQLLRDNRQQCDKLFNSLIPGVRERNASIRKQFANAASYLARFVSPNHMMALVKNVVKDLLTENEESKQAARHVLRNLSANCSEILEGVSTKIVPYVFLETCQEVIKGDDASKTRHEEWMELWAELVPSTSSAARLYKDEIIETSLDIIANNEVWKVRAQAAKMLGITADALENNLGPDNTEKIVQSLLPSLSGRIWTGKEEILNAVWKVINAGGSGYRESVSGEKMDEITTVLKREASKRNVDYSSVGLCALANVCVTLEDTKSADWLRNKVAENIDKALGSQDKDSDSDDMEGCTNLEKSIKISKIITSNLTALVISMKAYKEGNDSMETMRAVCSYLLNNSIAWKSKQNMINVLIECIEKWQLRSTTNVTELVGALSDTAEEMSKQLRSTVAQDALRAIEYLKRRDNVFAIESDNAMEQ